MFAIQKSVGAKAVQTRESSNARRTVRRLSPQLEVLEARTCLSSLPMQLADTNSLPQGSNPHRITELGSDVVFAANDRQLGYGLWKTDGTDAGTQQIVRMNQNAIPFESIRHSGVVGEKVVLTTTDFFSGQIGLWATDGTEAGSGTISNLGSDLHNIHVSDAAVVNASFWLLVSREGYSEMWSSDGTRDGTGIIAVLDANVPSHASNLTALNGVAIFTLWRHEQETELWRSDGTASGTFKINSLANTSVPSGGFAVTDEAAYFFLSPDRTIEDTHYRHELWRTDGTTNGKRLIQTFESSHELYEQPVVTTNKGVLFLASDSELRRQLWSFDESSKNVTMLTNFSKRVYGFRDFKKAGNDVFFVANGPSGSELWSTNGSPNGTSRIRGFGSSSFGDGRIQNLVAMGSQVYFSANAGDRLRLWTSDGSDAGTKTVGELFEPQELHPVGTELYLSANDAVVGRELWRVDTISGEANLVKDISLGTADATMHNWIELGSEHFFIAQEQYSSAMAGLWRTTGLPETTQLLNQFDLNFTSTNTRQLTTIDDRILWLATNENDHSPNVWQRDLESNEVKQITSFRFEGIATLNSPRFYEMFVVDDQVYLKSKDQLWRVDESAPKGASLVYDFDTDGYLWQSIVLEGHLVTFLAFADPESLSYRTAIWTTDPSNNATTRIAIIEGQPFEIIRVEERLVFRVGHGDESSLWVTDGSNAGTEPLHHPDQASAFLPYTSSVNSGQIPYQVRYPDRRKQLWMTDGTHQGTRLIVDLTPFQSVDLNDLVVFGDHIYFTATDEGEGEELWVTDGTDEGTRLLFDILPGPESSNPSQFLVHDDQIYFAADDGVHGNELWVSDGSEEGTHRVADIFPGSVGSYPSHIASTEFGIVFSANDGVHGREPWVILDERRGDFDGDHRVDANDVDLLCAAIQFGDINPQFDLDHNSNVDLKDIDELMSRIIGSAIGDLNLDGEFDVADLLLLPLGSSYEQGVNENLNWSSGDFNCDGQFDSSDLVRAFEQATFLNPSRAPYTHHRDVENLSLVASSILSRPDEHKRQSTGNLASKLAHGRSRFPIRNG